MDGDQGVGREVKRLREARGWSQTRLAAEADMSVSGVSMIESGHRNLTTTTLAKLAGALGVEVRDLFPKEQPPLPDLPEEWREYAERLVMAEDEDLLEELRGGDPAFIDWLLQIEGRLGRTIGQWAAEDAPDPRTLWASNRREELAGASGEGGLDSLGVFEAVHEAVLAQREREGQAFARAREAPGIPQTVHGGLEELRRGLLAEVPEPAILGQMLFGALTNAMHRLVALEQESAQRRGEGATREGAPAPSAAERLQGANDWADLFERLGQVSRNEFEQLAGAEEPPSYQECFAFSVRSDMAYIGARHIAETKGLLVDAEGDSEAERAAKQRVRDALDGLLQTCEDVGHITPAGRERARDEMEEMLLELTRRGA
jgi:transcriptional regulator with XRE-family HTH domain